MAPTTRSPAEQANTCRQSRRRRELNRIRVDPSLDRGARAGQAHTTLAPDADQSAPPPSPIRPDDAEPCVRDERHSRPEIEAHSEVAFRLRGVVHERLLHGPPEINVGRQAEPAPRHSATDPHAQHVPVHRRTLQSIGEVSGHVMELP